MLFAVFTFHCTPPPAFVTMATLLCPAAMHTLVPTHARRHHQSIPLVFGNHVLPVDVLILFLGLLPPGRHVSVRVCDQPGPMADIEHYFHKGWYVDQRDTVTLAFMIMCTFAYTCECSVGHATHALMPVHD